jgi:hypothetical protein
MPRDPQTIFLPADPSQGLPARVVPWITVHPYQPPDEASNNPAGPVESDGYPNDWIALPSPAAPGAAQPAPSPQPAFANPTISDRPELARDPVPSAPNDWFVPAPYGDGHPNDWIGLPATPNTPQLAPSPQPSSPSPAISNRPAPRPDPFTDYWSRIPANHLTQFAWHPPIFPDSLGRYPSAVPAPAPVDMSPLAGYGLLGGLANLQQTPASPPAGGLLGPLLQPATPGQRVSQFGLFGALSPGLSNNPPSLLNGLPQRSFAAPSSIDTSSAPFVSGPRIGAAAGMSPYPRAPATKTVQPSPFGSGPLPADVPAASNAMPGLLGALGQGLMSGTHQLNQTLQSYSDAPPVAEVDQSPAAQPIQLSDLTSPWSQLTPKVAFRFAQSYPTLAGGVAGGVVGGELGLLGGPVGSTVGAIGGGAIGAGLASAIQTLGPAFAAELQKSPNDPEGAWKRAWTQAEISGAFSGASWAAFPIRLFQGPVKQLLFQALGVQPALSVAQRATENILEGRPLGEGLGEAYGDGVVHSLIPALGHTAVNGILSMRRGPPGRGVWDWPAIKRGRELEPLFGQNLDPNFPTIDIWHPEIGTATSLKSIDLEAPGYQVGGKYPNALYNKLSKHIDTLAGFTDTTYRDVTVLERDVKSRVLTVIVPSRGTAKQRQVLRNIVEVGRQRGVVVSIRPFKGVPK